MIAAKISPLLLKQLQRVPASMDDNMEYRPCQVTLKDGRILDRVYVVEARQLVQSCGVSALKNAGKRFVRIEDVSKIEDSPVRLPAQLANKMYRAGGTGMGNCVFTLILKDERVIPQITGNAVDFPSLPAGVTTDMIADLKCHVGRDSNPTPGPEYHWCLYSRE